MLPLVATVGYGVRTLVRTYDPFRVLSMLNGRMEALFALLFEKGNR